MPYGHGHEMVIRSYAPRESEMSDPPRDSTMSENDIYRYSFDLYTRHSNAKRKVANSIIDFMESHSLSNVMDVGAGNGMLTRELLRFTDDIYAVEPNELFWPALQELHSAGLRFAGARAQDLETAGDEKFDLVLMSYLLDSVPAEQVQSICETVRTYLNEKGVMVGVTYVDGCPWDAYMLAVESIFGTSRSRGGLSRMYPLLRDLKYTIENVAIVRTQIWADSLRQLFDSTVFFHRRIATEYLAEASRLIPILENYAQRTREHYELHVDEVIYQISVTT